MVFFNYSTMQMAAKVVYYGPGLCGKTTNLQYIYGHTSNESRGEMVSLETETDRTLFFDLLPIDVGSIHGFNTRIQLYTVPGQVFYNTTRKLVLKGVDGVVFVADSQRPMVQANIDSLRNLEENLAEMQLSFDTVPLVLQYNKRDLPDVLTVDELNRAINRRGWEHYEASAVTGQGVFETLKGISRLTLINLKRRLAKMGTESRPPSPSARVGAPSTGGTKPGVPMPAAPVAAAPTPAPAPATAPAAAPRPSPSLPPTPLSAIAPPAAAPATAAPAPKAAPARAATPPPAKAKGHLDVLAELEKIRKQAMTPAAGAAAPHHAHLSTPPAAAHVAPSPPPAAPSSIPARAVAGNGRGEIHRTLELTLKRADFQRARRLTFSLRVEDTENKIVDGIRDFPVEIKDVAALEKILLHLNIAVHSKE